MSVENDIVCVDVVEVVTDYLEGALAPPQARRLERHLETCPGCTDYVEQLRLLATSLRGVTREAIPPALRDELVAAFRDFRASP